MPYMRAQCPNCGAAINIDSNTENIFCSHCESFVNLTGSVKTVHVNEDFSLNGLKNFSSLLTLINHLLVKGTNQKDKLRQLLHRASELDPDNKYLYDLIQSEIWEAEIENGVFIKYTGSAESVLVPNGITTISARAFTGNYSIAEITIPHSVTSIHDWAFQYSNTLTIKAYMHSYAKKYAFEKNIKVCILDIPPEKQKAVIKSQLLFNEINAFRLHSINSIKTSFEQEYTVDVNFFKLIFIAGLFIAVLLYTQLPNTIWFVCPIILSLSTAYYYYTYTVYYSKARDNFMASSQISFFNLRCTKILEHIGVRKDQLTLDFVKNKGYDLIDFADKLEKSKGKIVNINVASYCQKPDIKFTYIDYMKNRR